MHIHRNNLLNRRTSLKGIGVSLGLPWLEVMAGPKQQTAPARMAYVFMPNGVNADHWTPHGEGHDFKLSKTLSPLQPHQKDILILSELWNKNSKGGDGHYAKVANLLNGCEIVKTTGKGMRSDLSVDQLAAQKLGHHTPLPSLELSIQEPSTAVDNNVGFTALYGGYISWSSPSTPVAREIYPRLAFDRLFNRRSHATESRFLLDLVMQDIKKLQQKVGQADRHKLDEYFTSVRDLENRITFSEKDSKVIDADWIHQNRPATDKPQQVKEHQKLMYDIMAMAFQMDRTRIASLMLGRAVSGLNYSFLGHGITSSHHGISHHAGDPEKLKQYQLINQYHIEQFSSFLQKLKNLREGDQSILDRSMILFISGQRDGNSHSPYNLPVVLAGGSKLGLQTGRHIVYPKNTALCKLYISMLNRFGVKTNHFGDAEGELEHLTS